MGQGKTPAVDGRRSGTGVGLIIALVVALIAGLVAKNPEDFDLSRAPGHTDSQIDKPIAAL